MPSSRARRLAARLATCLLLTVPPTKALCQTEPGGSADAVIWEGSPLEWIERGEIVLHEAKEIDLDVPPVFFHLASPGEYPADARSATFPTGIGLELRAERTSFDAKDVPGSPPRNISHGGMWLATSLARDAAMAHIRQVAESLAAMPLSGFKTRAPKAGLDPSAFFASLDPSFFGEMPILICFEFPDSTFDTQILSGGWEGKSFSRRRSRIHPSEAAPICRSLTDRIRSQESSSSIPTRLAYERRPRRRLLFALFRSPDTPTEVAAGGSTYEIGRGSSTTYMPSDPEVDLWLARSMPVALRFRLEEEAGREPLRWALLDEWLVAVHPSKVKRPEGGIDVDLGRFTEELAEAARAHFPENLARTLRGASFVEASDLQAEPRTGSAGFQRGVLIEDLTRFLGSRPVVAVVCREDTAVYSLAPASAWMSVSNGEPFCKEMRHALSTLEPVPIE